MSEYSKSVTERLLYHSTVPELNSTSPLNGQNSRPLDPFTTNSFGRRPAHAVTRSSPPKWAPPQWRRRPLNRSRLPDASDHISIPTLRSKGPKYGVCKVPILGIVIIVLGTDLLFGSLDP